MIPGNGPCVNGLGPRDAPGKIRPPGAPGLKSLNPPAIRDAARPR